MPVTGWSVCCLRPSSTNDIGKVDIPDHILNKPGKLTAEEFAIIRNHSRNGGEAIDVAICRVMDADSSPLAGDRSGLAFLVTAGMIARWHHERWDGTGYPDRLAGEAIPLPARIMAVADVYDALRSAIALPRLPCGLATEACCH